MSAVVATAACGGGGAEPSTPTASASSPTESAPHTPSTPTTGPSDESTTLPSRCTRDHLDLSLGRVSPGAGNRYVPLVFTNTSTQPCSLHGYPGVTLIDSAGNRIGEPAERQGPDAPAVTLDPGGSAYAALHTVVEGVTDKPCWRPAAQVQAYPPGSTWALRTPADAFRVCGDVFEVHAVKPGKHP